MIEFSKHKDLETVRGEVLSENTAMLTMCAEFGFHIADDPHDLGVKTVTLQGMSHTVPCDNRDLGYYNRCLSAAADWARMAHMLWRAASESHAWRRELTTPFSTMTLLRS